GVAALDRPDRDLELAGRLQRRQGVPIDGEAGFGEKDPLPCVVDQRDPILLLESMDCHADTGLAHHELFGGPGNALLLGNLAEYPEVPMLMIGSIDLHGYLFRLD